MKKLVFAVALMLCAAVFPGRAEEKPAGPETVFKLTDWGYGRERKTITGSNRVTATAKLRNASKSSVTDVTVTLLYSTGLGEKIAAPVVQKIGALKAGESKALSFVSEFVPAFESYTLTIAYNGGKKEEWYGNSDAAQPEPKSALVKGDANVSILGKEAAVDKNGLFTATLHVKNEGTEVAKNVKVTVTFFDMRKTKIKEWFGALGSGTVKGGAEENIAVSFPNAPRVFGSYAIKLNNDEVNPEAALAGGDFSGAAEVEFAHFKFEHIDANKSGFRVQTDCRNGLKNAAEHIKLALIFYSAKHREVKRFTHEIPGTLEPGETRSLTFEIPGLPSYEEYEQSITYNALDKGPSRKNAPPSAAGLPKFENKPDVEIVFGEPQRAAGGSVQLPGAVRNGRASAVKDLAIKLALLDAAGAKIGSAEKLLPVPLIAGGAREFTITIPDAPAFAKFSFTFQCSGADAVGGDKKSSQKKDAPADPLHLAL